MKGAKTLLITVLTYKKNNFSESSTLESISRFVDSIKNCNVKIVIWNNGPNIITDDLNFNIKTTIINDLKNTALSVAYNKVIQDHLADFYLILDDDSELSLEYLNEITNKIKSDDLKYLTVPTINVLSTIVSPVNDRERTALTSGIHSTEGFRAIGSGLLFPWCVVDAFKGRVFEESLNLYGVDTVFCYEYSIKYDKICVLNSTIDHEVAGLSIISNESYIFREKNLIDAMIFIFINYPFKRYLYSKRILGLIVKYVCRVKSVDIIHELFKSIKKHIAQKQGKK